METLLDNYYALIGVPASAAEDEIRTALKAAKRTWIGRQNSPDHERRIEAERTVKALDEAERVLLDADARRRYDDDLQRRAHDAAIDEGRQERRVDPQGKPSTTSDNWVDRAMTYLDAGSVHAAIRAAEEAIQADRTNVRAWTARGRAHLAAGKFDEAEFDYLEACHLDARDVYLRIELADCRCRMKRFDAAFSALQDGYRIEPDRYDLHVAMADCYAAAGTPSMAVDFLEKLADTHPENAGYRFCLALMLVRTVEEEVATQSFDGMYSFGSKSQVAKADELLTRAEALLADSPADAAAVGVTSTRAFLSRMDGRTFRWRGPWWLWVSALVVALTFLAGAGGLAGSALGLLLLVGYAMLARSILFPRRYTL